MDRIIFGDNQFLGVNHMSEQTSMRQAQKFKTSEDIFNILNYVNSIDIKSFMFTTHHQFEPVFDKMKNKPEFKDFKLIPCMPYAHKYANAMTELGIFGAIEKFVPGNKVIAGLKGIGSLVNLNPLPIMKLLIDSEMKQLKGYNVEAIFLQNIVVDLILGLGMVDILGEFSHYVEKKYKAKAGFITMNHNELYNILTKKVGITKPIICSGINKVGFRMNPSQKIVEDTISNAEGTTIAMSVFASGAVQPKEGIEYIKQLKGIDSILFGASTPAHILGTKELIESDT